MERGCAKPANQISERKIINYVQVFAVEKSNAPTVKRVEFVSDRMLHLFLGGCCWNVIVLIVQVHLEDKIVDVKEG